MKILIVFNHPAPYKVKLFNELAKKVDLDVIFERKSARNRPVDFYKDNEYKFNCMFLKHGAFGDENSNTGELKRFLKKNHEKYDLIIMNGYSTLSEMRAIKYLKKHHIRFGLYINGGIVKNDSKLKFNLKKSFISSADYYFSPSDEANKYLVHYGANPEKINIYSYSTIYESDILSKPIGEKEKESLKAKYGLPNKDVFISASQFIERKNILFLLDCFKGLDKHLVLVGSGPQKEEYLNFIKDNQMDNVEIRDYLPKEELFALLKACDYFITLSKEDIYGHTINEAMANGLPVISSDKVVAAFKLIKNGENGYIVPLSKEDIISKINLMSTSMSKKALESAKENTVEKMAIEHLEIFERLKK